MTTILPRVSLARIEEYTVETTPDADIVVNANETNWNMPADLVAEVQQVVAKNAFNRYPSMNCEELCEPIGAAWGVDPLTVIIGNGSSELLEKVCYAFGGTGRKIAYPVPSFSMYETYCVLADSEPAPFQLTPEGYIDPDAVIAFCKKEKPALLIICNPNNPTGNYTPRDAMVKIIRNVDCPVVMDEAYLDFAVEEGDPKELTTMELVHEVDNLVVLKTFSKAYGLANLRVGYGIGSPEVMKVLHKVILPYMTNGISLQTAKLLFSKPEVLANRVKAIVSGRTYLRKGFEDLGFFVMPSATNFLLVRPVGAVLDTLVKKGGITAADEAAKQKAAGTYFFKQMLERKVLIRNFSQNSYIPGGLRISVGTEEENKIIIETAAAILKEA